MRSIRTPRGRFVAGVVVALALAAGASVPFAVWHDGYPDLAVLPTLLVAGVVAYVLGRHGREAGRDRDHARGALAAVAATAPDAVVKVDEAGVVVDWSDAADVLGHSPEERVGRPVAELAADEEARAALAALLDAARAGEHAPAREVLVSRGDASTRTIRLGAAPVVTEGRPEGAILVGTDLEQVRRWQERSLEAQARYDALENHLSGIAYVHPPGSRDAPLHVGRQVEALLGYAPDECVGRPLLLVDSIHPQDRARVERELAASDGDRFRSEYRLVARSGRIVDVADAALTIRGVDGEPTHVQGLLWDVSERRLAEEERERLAGREEEARKEAAARQARLDVLAEATRLLAAPGETRARLERAATCVVGSFADWCTIDLLDEDGSARREIVVHSTPRPSQRTDPTAEVDAFALDVARSGRAHLDAERVSVPLVSRGRSLGVLTFVATRPGRTYGAADLAVAEQLARALALVVDVGRLHRAVEEGAEATRVLTYVGDGVLLLDRSAVVRLFNPAAEAITGLTADDVVGRPAGDAMAGWRTIEGRIPVTDAPERGQPDTLPIETEAGERWISIAGVRFFGGTVYAFRDVTADHRLDELKAEFVATASHELRTPLAAVYGAAQTLRRHDFALDESGRERFVTLIVEESDRLSRIVNEILLANQLDAGRLDLYTEPFDPADLVERVVESTRIHAGAGVSLRVAAPKDIPLVAADREKARQVLVNLIENAIKYSPDGGDIEVGATSVDDAVTFYVRDEGLGIPADEQARIFEKFYRLDPGMARGVGGTGLGLYICRELVERMGGEISVESEAGAGSTFKFELPRADTNAARPVAPEGGPAQDVRVAPASG